MGNWPEKFWMKDNKIFYEGGEPSDAFIFVEEIAEVGGKIAVYYHRTTEDEVIAFVDERDNFTVMDVK